MFRKLDLFPFSGERKETPTLLGPLERTDLNHWTTLLQKSDDSERCRNYSQFAFLSKSSMVFLNTYAA
jgi:hypothetical protein